MQPRANYDVTNQHTIADFILRNLPRHKQFALSTSDAEGKPWVVCVNLAYDTNLSIIWRSLTTTEHSQHVRARPDVALCVFSETPGVGDFGLYCKAVAHEVNDPEELQRLLAVRYAGRDIPSPQDFLGTAPSRLYSAQLAEAWVNDDRHQKRQLI